MRETLMPPDAPTTGRQARVDCHTHFGTRDDAGEDFRGDVVRAWGSYPLDLEVADLAEAGRDVDVAIVFALDAQLAGITVSNESVADAIEGHPELIGFASVDPSRPDAGDRAERALGELRLRGLKMGPIYTGVHPHDPRTLRLVSIAASRGVPIVWHQGTTFSRNGPLEFARPFLLDRVAREFPDVPMWVAHLGHPWCEETMALIRKHPRMYADVSALVTRPFQLYRALAAALEYRVLDKLLFGSDWPFFTAAQTAESIRNVNAIVEGTGLPRIPEASIEAIFERDTLALLGLVAAAA
jgi:predicted TIM-barrel fold metal-dependent hydrolase